MTSLAQLAFGLALMIVPPYAVRLTSSNGRHARRRQP